MSGELELNIKLTPSAQAMLDKLDNLISGNLKPTIDLQVKNLDQLTQVNQNLLAINQTLGNLNIANVDRLSSSFKNVAQSVKETKVEMDSLAAITKRIIDADVAAGEALIRQAQQYTAYSRTSGPGGIGGTQQISGAGGGFADLFSGGSPANRLPIRNAQSGTFDFAFSPFSPGSGPTTRQFTNQAVSVAGLPPNLLNAYAQIYGNTANALKQQYINQPAPNNQIINPLLLNLMAQKQQEVASGGADFLKGIVNNKAKNSFISGLSNESGGSLLPLIQAIGGGTGGVAGFIGAKVGGKLGGPEGAALGAAGLPIVFQGVAEAFNKVKESLVDAAQAGLVFERSILGVSGILSQSSQFVGGNGSPVGVGDQVRLQNQRARGIQLTARSAAAQVGIGGEAESSLVQAIITAAGSRGIQLEASQAATLVSRLGAAINVFSPELASQPNIVRRDIFDIVRDVPQGSRTAVGSRIPQVVEQLKTAQTGDELVRATNQLEQLILVFKNSDNAITNIQRFNAIIEITKTNFGEALVDKVTPSLKSLVDLLNSEETSSAFSKFGEGIGTFINAIGLIGIDLAKGTSKFINNNTPLGVATEGAFKGTKDQNQIFSGALAGGLAGGALGSFIPGLGTIAGGVIGAGTGAVAAANEIEVSNEALIKKGDQITNNPVFTQAKIEELKLNKIDNLLRRGGLKPEEINSATGLGEQGPEFGLEKFLSGRQNSIGVFTKGITQGGFGEGSGLTNDIVLGRAFGAGKGAIDKLKSIDQLNLANGTTLESQQSLLQGSNINDRLSLANDNVGIAKLSGDTNLILQAERELASVRKDSYDITKRLAEIENEKDKSVAQSINRTGALGRISGGKADLNALQGEFNREQDPVKANALRGRIFAQQASNELAPSEELSKTLRSGENINNISNSLVNFDLKVKQATYSLEDLKAKAATFGDELALEKAEKEGNVVELLKNYKKQGGLESDLGPEYLATLNKLNISGLELEGEDSLFTADRNRIIGKGRLERGIFSADPQRLARQAVNGYLDNQQNINNTNNFLKNAPLEKQALGADLVTANLQFAQQIGNFGRSIDKISDSLKGTVDGLKKLIEALDPAKLAAANAEGINKSIGGRR